MPSLKPCTPQWTGQLRLRTASLDEATLLHRRLHGMPIWTGNAWCHMAVLNPLLPVWTSATASGGSSGPASGPPARQ